ncbi:MAG: amidohydrolase [Proteobacteria bacterium]|nr:amidohydrolase [Pseudomonadota bacterium]
MKRRDFCKLMAAGAAGLLAGGPLWPMLTEAKTNRAWWDWFCGQAPPRPPAFRVCDSHFHFYDFVQHTDGIPALIEAMDRNGVDHIMFSGMPLIKKWDRDAHQAPVYYLDNNGRTYWYSATDMLLARTLLDKVPEKERSRFHPFICGFNGTDLYAVEHVERMLDAYDGLWHGIGEVFGHRDDLTNMTFGETARGDHPALMKIYQLAGRLDLPVVLHNNVSSQGRPAELLYWPEVERAVGENPMTRFIWAHAGLSRHFEDIDQARYAARLGTLLEKHPNLHIDLSWMVFEDYIAPDPLAGPSKAWLDLIGSFPTRFMIGSDSIGRFSEEALTCADGRRDPRLMKYAFNIRKYHVLLERLRPAAARMVARDNFLDILPARVRKGLGREG